MVDNTSPIIPALYHAVCQRCGRTFELLATEGNPDPVETIPCEPCGQATPHTLTRDPNAKVWPVESVTP